MIARCAADGRSLFAAPIPTPVNHLLALIAVPLMTAADFAGPPICEGPVPWCTRPVPLIALFRAAGTDKLGAALGCVMRFAPTPTPFGVANGATPRPTGGT